MAAKESKLSELHELLAAQMVDEINWYRENDIPVPAADKAAIAKFLKDNSITCDPADKGDLERLRDEFKASSQARREKASKALALSAEDIVGLYGAN
ncbi:terminase small subunit [Pseudomonas phage pphageT12]|nr:terminase small subunit [Pseudomonas phage pphageT12]